MKDSARVLDRGFAEAARVIRGGVTEKEAASLIELSFRKAGADGLAFDTIVASGPRAALPHGKASSKRVKRGELVVADMGVALNGYNSDETRTFSVGRPSPEQRKVYQTVLDAQMRAIEKVAPGVKAAEVDSEARSLIEKAGYGKFFGHGLGHGVGLDVHEPPSLSPLSKETLEEGMVVTIEPGIYIPGWGGVRIEDMVLVMKDGFEVLTTTSKDLVSL
ncbi:MAG: M24 family metallopeptidase [Deltaproteobacteria bacterium]|nr:M24 family metallopeptidase [Deltaproteobacteria bacterium]